MKKKWIKILATLFACATLALGFTACGDKENSSSDSSSGGDVSTEQSSSDSSSDSFDNNSGDNSSEQTHTHNYMAVTTAPTCTAQGFTTYTCACGDDYITDYVNALEHDFTNYISDNNATYEKDGTKTATCNRNGCEETDTVTDTGTKLQSGISFKTLSVNGTDVYGKVRNTTETFSFINEVTAVGTAKYVVSLDIYGIQQVATKTIPLTVGDNTVYITETVDDEPVNVYTVTVRRRPMYDVTFNVNGGTTVEKQVIEEDFCASQPTTTKTGYTFTAWDYDFSKPITNNTEITASWTASTNTPYKVEYYLQNLENDEYTLATTENKTGTTDTTANAEIKLFTHFTHIETATDSGNIAPDGSTVLKVYYTRNKYTLSVDNADGGGTITNTGTYKYGTDITATASVYLGYDFGWYHGNTLLSTDLIYTFTVEQDIVAKFTVKTEMSNFDFTATATACQITGIKAQSVANIVVPDFVTSIDGGAFSGCSSLTEITLPFVGASKSATSASSSTLFGYIFGSSSYIGGTATVQFYSSSNYTTYYIPTSLKKVTITGGYIFYGAFYNCRGLRSIEIPDSVTHIGDYAVYNCDDLTSITIPDGVTRIGNYVFYCCSSLTSVVIGDSVTSIGGYAFYNCYRLTSVEIPDSVTDIGDYAFYKCSGLTSITIPDSVTRIGSDAFRDCSNLTGVYITDIESWCNISFNAGQYDSGCSNPLRYAKNLYLNNELVTELEIPNTITEIKAYAFYWCSSLTSVEIPNVVTSIGYNAFYCCSGLTGIEIPDSVTSIGEYAFGGCSGLTEIKYNAINCADFSLPNGVFSGAGRSGNGITVTIGANVEKIPTFFFCPNTSNGDLDYYYSNVPKIISVVFEEGSVCTSIGYQAFYGCSSLTSVVIGDSVTSIGEGAFYSGSLTSVYYKGTEEDWSAISISSYNEILTNAKQYFYSETEPALNADGTAYVGNYWHYDENGEIAVWVYTKNEE